MIQDIKRSRILFVDDEAKVLNGIRRMVHSQKHRWETAFVESGKAALAALAQKPFDIIVSDMRMPEMDGVELMQQVQQQFPDTIRMVLSGQADKEQIARSIGIIHQFLTKPCSTEILIATIERAINLRQTFENDKLKKLVSQINAIPSLSANMQALFSEIQQPEPSIKRVSAIIAEDLGMSSKVLQLVNSSFFGVADRVNSIEMAVKLLGLTIIHALVISFHVFSEFRVPKHSTFNADALWDHCIKVSGISRKLATLYHLGYKESGDAQIAGLLHDVGKIMLAVKMPAELEKMQHELSGNPVNRFTIEQEVFGATHAEIGGYLMGLWGLPDDVVLAIVEHHDPEVLADQPVSAAALVFAANIISHEISGVLPEMPEMLLSEVQKKLLDEIRKVYFQSVQLEEITDV